MHHVWNVSHSEIRLHSMMSMPVSGIREGEGFVTEKVGMRNRLMGMEMAE